VVCIFLLFFSISVLRVSAQDEPVGQASEAGQAIDPYREAERGMAIGAVDSEQAARGAASSGWAIFRTLLALIVAAAAIYGVVYLIKRASRRTEAKNPFLKLLASAHLGSNRYVHVVSLGSKAWLVGAADGGVNLLSEVADEDTLNAMFLDDSQKGGAAATGRIFDFKTMLSKMGIPVQPADSGAENIRKRRERLKGL
jgi:flagellar protein FliO/FliZ